jgi:mutator protein MutT
MNAPVDVVIGIVVRDGNILICQRRQNDTLAGYWEFPGGKLEPGESHEQCLERELAEELAIRVGPLRELEIIEFEYPKTQVRLHPYLCEHVAGEPQALASQRTAWVSPADLQNYKFPPANDGLIADLARQFRSPTAR